MKRGFLLLPLALLGLSACDSDSNNTRSSDKTAYQYELTLTNLTVAQPLSPTAVVLHQANWQAFVAGTAASEAIEQLAEAGSPQALLTAADNDSAVYTTGSFTTPTPPGQTSAILPLMVDAQNAKEAYLSVLGMLVNTNDAFAAGQKLSLAGLQAGQSRSWNLSTYDAGTEANSETANTIPGPAASASNGQAEGFNATRDDEQPFVHIHPGVLTRDEGLTGSALTEFHRWQDPAIRVSITRTQ